jgi:hypothetical protein
MKRHSGLIRLHVYSAGKITLKFLHPKPSGKRGKLAKSAAHNLLERMQAHEASWWCSQGAAGMIYQKQG